MYRNPKVYQLLLLIFICALSHDYALADNDWFYSEIVSEDGVPLVVAETGNPEATPILFIHGYSQSLMSWKYQLNDSDLRSNFRLVTFDLRGHGASGKPWAVDAYESRDWANDVAAIISAKSLNRPILVGWSGGASVIAAYLRYYGQTDVSGLVLVGGLLSLAPPADAPPQEAGAPTEMNAVQRATTYMASSDIATKLEGTEALVGMVTSGPLSDQDYMETLASNLMSPAYVSAAMIKNRTTYEDLSGKIELPTLLMHGSADALIPYKQSVTNQGLIPGSQLKSYDGVGHALFLEKPEMFNDDVAEFANRIHHGTQQ